MIQCVLQTSSCGRGGDDDDDDDGCDYGDDHRRSRRGVCWALRIGRPRTRSP